MKTLRMLGVTVVVGIGIGALVSAYLPNFNFGDFGLGGKSIGLPTTASSTDGDQTEQTLEQTKTVGIDDLPDTPVDSTLENVSQEPPKVIYILIDGRDYLLRRGPEGKAPFQPADLQTIVDVAQATTGDDLGIRVRIAQKSSARELSERALRTALQDAGIPNDSVRWKDDPVD